MTTTASNANTMVMKPPAGLSPSEVGHFVRLAATHAQQSATKPGDGELLSLAAKSLALADACRQRVAADGLVVGGRHGQVANPALMVLQKSEAAALRALTALGFGCSKRESPPLTPDDGDEYEVDPYFGGRIKKKPATR